MCGVLSLSLGALCKCKKQIMCGSVWTQQCFVLNNLLVFTVLYYTALIKNIYPVFAILTSLISMLAYKNLHQMQKYS